MLSWPGCFRFVLHVHYSTNPQEGNIWAVIIRVMEKCSLFSDSDHMYSQEIKNLWINHLRLLLFSELFSFAWSIYSWKYINKNIHLLIRCLTVKHIFMCTSISPMYTSSTSIASNIKSLCLMIYYTSHRSTQTRRRDLIVPCWCKIYWLAKYNHLIWVFHRHISLFFV